MDDFSLSFEGMEALVSDLGKAMELHPNAMENSLRRSGIRFKAHLRGIVKGRVRERTGKLTKGFWVSQVKGFREDMEIDFSAETKKTNPHWHLVENGHEVIKPLTRKGKRLEGGGEKTAPGFVPGIKVMPGARKSFEPRFVAELEKARDKVLREAGLL
ncbi:hypothetical protein D3Z38_11600 [Clostridiales bacterium]|nr:hypothetical protein [Clostridiales bacterium]